MKIFNKLSLAIVVSLGILLLPIAADNGNAQCGSSYLCGIPQTTQTVQKPAPRPAPYPEASHEVTIEEAPEVEVIPAAGPVQGGTFWHKWNRYGSWWENGEDHGKWWNWNDWNNYNNRYNRDDSYAYGAPTDTGGCYGGDCGPSMSYSSGGPSYGGSPIGNGSYGGGPGYLGGFDSNPYWGFAMGHPSGFGRDGMRHPGRGFRSTPGRHNFGHPQSRHDGRMRPFARGGDRPRQHAMRGGHPMHRGWQTKNFHSLPSDHEKIEWINEDVNPQEKLYPKKEWETVEQQNDLNQKTEWVTQNTWPERDLNPNRWVAQTVNPANSSGTVMRWVAKESGREGTAVKAVTKLTSKP